MKRITLLFCGLFALLLVGNLQGQSQILSGDRAAQLVGQSDELRLKGPEQHISYLKFKEDAHLNLAQLFSFLRDSLGMNAAYTFQQIDRQKDNLGEEHLRFQQYYNGIPIRSAHLVLHLKEGAVMAISGLFYTKPFANQQLNVSEDEALQLALKTVSARVYKWEDSEEEKFIKREQNNPSATFYPNAEMYYFGKQLSTKTTDQLLCYRFDIYAQEPLSRDYLYVNATTGEIVFKESQIHHINTNTTAHSAYSGVRDIVSDSVSANVFRLRESSRGNGVETYNMKNGRTYANAVDFIDSTNAWANFIPAIDKYAIDAHWGAEMTYDYFYQTYNRNSIDNQGFALKSYIHYDLNYVNAFWDGQRMTYGDGDNTTSPLTSLDIVGHEIAHGLTRSTSNLIYASESGALNESFSDIFGFSVEKFARPNKWNWEIAEDLGNSFRSMENPKSYGNPDTYGGVNWTSQVNCSPLPSNDRCGVHNNSGVQNYWFYLLSKGGLGINDIGDSIKVDSIGTTKAEAIAFRTNTIYLSPSSDFSDARFFSFRSAVDLFGACSAEVESTINAWHAVGVGEAYKSGVEVDFVALNDTAFCSSPAQVQFSSQSNNVYNYKWYFGDGDSSILRSPSHTYLNEGNYTVSLYAEGGSCGKDSLIRQNYIRIDSSIECLTVLNGTQTSNDCKGRFYDNGGLNGNYITDKSDTLYILPSNSERVLLQFTHLVVEAGNAGFCNKDYVEVYDGPSTNSPSLGRYCNNILPPDSILSSSNALTIVFYSDLYVANRGFGASWKCLPSSHAPIAHFRANTDSTCDGRLKFYDLSENGVNQWTWDFGDGSTSNAKNPTHEYVSNGTFDVQLKVQNSMGEDSLLISSMVYVNRPPAPIGENDTVCYNGNMTLKVSSQTTNQWYTSELDDNEFLKSDSLSLSRLKSNETYYVENFISASKKTVVPFIISGSTYFSDSSAALYFDVEEPMILESIVLSSNSAKNRKVIIRNASGKIIHSKLVFVPAFAVQTKLNFVLYPDTGYSISIDDRNPAMKINSTGASYPYSVPGLMKITRSNLGSSAIPFFYYWTVLPLPCRSPRLKISAVVDSSCTITAIDQLTKEAEMLEVHPNPFKDNFTISFEHSSENFNLYLYNSEGRLVYKRTNVKGAELQTLELGEATLSNGVYFLKIQTENKVYQRKLVKVSN